MPDGVYESEIENRPLGQPLRYRLRVHKTGDTIHVVTEVIELRESKSRPDQGIVTFLAIVVAVLVVIALIVLYGIASGREVNFEAAMLFAMTGFVGTVAFCRFLLRGKVIE